MPPEEIESIEPASNVADDLFARLMRLTHSKEDFLTECFAAILQSDPRARSQYWRILSKSLPATLRNRTIDEIRTQCPSADRKARFDMVLRAGPVRLAVEHKLESPQGKKQLFRYLGFPRREIRYLAFVAADYQKIPKNVLNKPSRYVRPANEDHFIWADFYSILQDAEKRKLPFARATKRLFDRRGLQPAHPLIGYLHSRDPDVPNKSDERLRKAEQPLRAALKRKWRTVVSSMWKNRSSEIWIDNGPSGVLGQVWFDPISNPGTLRMRFRATSQVKQEAVFERLKNSRSLPHRHHMTIIKEPRSQTKNYPWFVELRIPWRVLLARATKKATLPNMLRRFVLALMKAIDRSCV